MAEAAAGSKLGKWLMTVGIGIFTVIPPIVDILTPTHIFNPDWVPHARFHTMWAIISASSIGALALWILWRGPAQQSVRTHITGAIGACVLGSFMLATATMSLYGGSLSDVKDLRSSVGGVDASLNLITFAVALMTILVGWRLSVRPNGS